ncbi:MAG: adenylosuccinate lyase [Candidatus Gastranaerophilales bacterium]|nr:adenylosuccinate lyase [Candidatus Gastranaerophilales bacterium]
MIERYTREEMNKIWSLENKFQTYLEVELAVCDAYKQIGTLSDNIVNDIKVKAKFNISRIDEIEAEVKHDFIAFLTCVNENVGENSRFIHMGLTSSDVIDTALALQVKQANEIIEKDIKNLIDLLSKKAVQYKNTVCIGRSHGIHAEPMTFGVKLCNWLEIMKRNLKRFEFAKEEMATGQISGPIGTYSNISPEIEKITCELLGLKPATVSTQVIQRDLHANYIQTLSLIATTIEQFAVELRHLQRSEVLEVEEGFSKGQKGSSAMPHKKNPISAENLSGLARIVRSNSIVALENVVLWHERDISHSSAERIIFPDTTILIDYMLNRFINLLDNLVVHEDRMKENSTLFGGCVFSQKVLLALTNKGLSREDAYKIVQKNALSAWGKPDGNFKHNLLNDEEVKKYFSNAELEDIFNIDDYLKNIDFIYKRLGLY